MIANGSFLLNEAVVNPARRPLAERVIEWVADDASAGRARRRAVSCWGVSAETLTIWALMRRIPSLALGRDPGGPGRTAARRWRVLLAWAAPARTHPRGPIGPPNTPWRSGPCWRERRPRRKPMSCSIATSDGDSRERLDPANLRPLPTAGSSPNSSTTGRLRSPTLT